MFNTAVCIDEPVTSTTVGVDVMTGLEFDIAVAIPKSWLLESNGGVTVLTVLSEMVIGLLEELVHD